MSRVQGIGITGGMFLLDKTNGTIAAGLRVGGFITGGNDNGDLVYSGAMNFIDNDAQHGFLRSVAINYRLQRESTLVGTCSRDDGFLDFHVGAKCYFSGSRKVVRAFP